MNGERSNDKAGDDAQLQEVSEHDEEVSLERVRYSVRKSYTNQLLMGYRPGCCQHMLGTELVGAGPGMVSRGSQRGWIHWAGSGILQYHGANVHNLPHPLEPQAPCKSRAHAESLTLRLRTCVVDDKL